MGRSRAEEEEEYEVNEVEDTITGSVGSRLCLVSSELGLKKTASNERGGVLDPGSRYVRTYYPLSLLYSTV